MSKSTLNSAQRIQKTVLSPNGPFNEEIAQYMRSHGMKKLEEFALKCGIGATTLYDLVLGKKTIAGSQIRPSVETLRRLADTLKVPMHELVYKIEPDAYGASTRQPATAIQLPIHIAGFVGAGEQQSRESEQEIFVEENFARGRDLVAFEVRGSSMEGGKHPIFDGDIVIVNRNDKGLETAAVVARITGDGYVCKRPSIDPRTGKLHQLKSANLDFDDPEFSVIPSARVEELVGRVVRVISSL